MRTLILKESQVRRIFHEAGKQIGKKEMDILDAVVREKIYEIIRIMRKFRRVDSNEIFYVFKK